TPVSYAPIGGNDHALSTDTQSLIMTALERNPHGAALALSTPIPQQFQISYLLEGRTDPVKILYEVGNFGDGGAQFARVYTAAVDWFHQDAGLAHLEHDPSQAAEDLKAGNSLTISLVDETVHGPNHIGAMDDAVVADLTNHHLADLYDSAGMEQGGTEIAYVDTLHGNNLVFTLGGERDLLKTIADHRPEADKQLLDAAAGYQAQLVYDNTDVPYTHENGVWLHKVAAFTMIELNAHNIRLDDEFN